MPEALLACFARLGTDHLTVVESTAGWYWLNALLEDHGIEMVLAHDKHVEAISYAKVKTDKVDSHTLATLLCMKLIPCAHKISRELRDTRDVMRARHRYAWWTMMVYDLVEVQLHSHTNIIVPQRGLVCHSTVKGNCDSHGKRRAASPARQVLWRGRTHSKNTTRAIANYTSPREIPIR